MLNLASSMTVVTSGSETTVQPGYSTREINDRFIAFVAHDQSIVSIDGQSDADFNRSTW